ncbi:MAG: acyltransferase, partial [Betaproteobacteria bacterium]|nr:acyltransferase [Betaproteobacteria bacterium]
MLNFLPAPLVGVVAFLLLVLNVFFWVPLLLSLAIVRLILPFKGVRLAIDPLLVAIAEAWISGNSGWMALTQRTEWDVEGIEGLDPHNWYLVNSNHQTWVDIFVLQHLFNRRIPLLKFF